MGLGNRTVVSTLVSAAGVSGTASSFLLGGGTETTGNRDLQNSEFTVGILGTIIGRFVALDSNDLIQSTLTPESPAKTDTDGSVSPRAFE